jgi:hypothetical protein
MSGKNDPMFGKFEHPIKAIIEQESNILEKRKTILDALYNVEKSNRYAETVMAESDFDSFMSKEEGQNAANDSVQKTYEKTVYHVEFGKEFTITKKMVDDAKFGMAADMKNKPRAFVRAYYKTRVKLGAQALIQATKPEMTFNRAKVDLTTGDKLPLFHNAHPFFTDKMKGKTQSNYFYGEIATDVATLEKSISTLANKMRNFADENGDPMGYVADTLIIPCNRPDLETMAKKIVGTERTTGSNNNDINLQYGNWSLVVLDEWQTDADEIMIMSSEANKNLMGNMFYNRVELDIRSNVDDHNRNYYWNGYCRMGVGFCGFKHILRAKHSTSAVTNATKL